MKAIPRLLLGFSMVLFLKSFGAPFDAWQVHSLNSPGQYDGLMFAEGRFWRRNEFQPGPAWSVDGRNWTTVAGPTGPAGIAYGNGLLMMLSAQGTAVSTNGTEWTYHRKRPTTLDWLAFGSGVFVALQFNEILWTTDGASWTKAFPLDGSTAHLAVGLDYANDRFFASASGGGSKFLMVSTNGTNWESISHTEGTIESVAFGAGKYIAVGDRLTAFSLDAGFQVLGRAELAGARDVTFGGGTFVAVGDSIAYSADGIAWQQANKPPVGTLYQVAYGNGRFVAIGSSATVVSTNGVDWETTGIPISEITGLVHADGVFVGTGTKAQDAGSAVLVSTHRGEWTVLDALPGDSVVTELEFAEGQFLAAAGAKAYLATNILDWRETDTGFEGGIAGLAHFAGRFWGAGSNALGDGAIVEIAPGAAWRVVHTVPGMPLAGIEAGADRLVAIGSTNVASGWVFVSTNGVDWTGAAALGFPPGSIARQAGRFVIGGQFSGRAVSSNGVDWVQQADGQERLSFLSKPGGSLLAFHQITRNYTRALVSDDGGKTWARRLFTRLPEQAGGAADFLGAGAIGSRRVVVAQGPALIETDPLLPRFRTISREGTGLRLGFENWTGEPFAVESSPDLQDWRLVPDLGEANPLVIDTSWATRFYRLRAE